MSIIALYVDDEPGLLDIVKLFLEQTGEIVVDCAPCVEEAERRMMVKEYDVIISDYQMPETDGLEFLKRLRSRDSSIPFILLTGRGREEVAIDALNSGADFYMQKGGSLATQFAELKNYVKQGAQRFRSEKARQESERCFKSLVENSFEGIGIHIDGALIEVNNAFCEISGRSREELLGRKIESLFTERSWKRIEENLSKPTSEPYDVQLVRKDGTVISVKARGKDVPWKGRTARFSTVLDLSEQKSMEEELMERNNLIQNLIDVSMDIVWEIDASGIVTFISPTATKFLGYEPNEVVGRSALNLIASGSLKISESLLAERLREMREFTSSAYVSHKNGDIVYVEIQAAPFLGADGRLKGFRGVGRPVAHGHQEIVDGTAENVESGVEARSWTSRGQGRLGSLPT